MKTFTIPLKNESWQNLWDDLTGEGDYGDDH